jgi:hypothetical protein
MFQKKSSWVGARVLCLAMLLVAGDAFAQASPFSTGAGAFQGSFLAILTPVAVIAVMGLGAAAVLALAAPRGWDLYVARAVEAHRASLVAPLDDATTIAQDVIQRYSDNLSSKEAQNVRVLAEALRAKETKLSEDIPPQYAAMAVPALRYVEACRTTGLRSVRITEDDERAQAAWRDFQAKDRSFDDSAMPSERRLALIRLWEDQLNARENALRDEQALVEALDELRTSNDAIKLLYPAVEFLDPAHLDGARKEHVGQRETARVDIRRLRDRLEVGRAGVRHAGTKTR